MMQRPSVFIGLVYLVVGLLFAFNSAPRSGAETHWGYALTGITCLILSGKFLGLPLNRDTLMGKTGKPDPFE